MTDLAASRYAHLDPKALQVIDIEGPERIVSRWGNLWVGYPRLKEIYDKMEVMLMTPPSTRPRNLLLLGESNVGKTTMLRRWAERKNREAAEAERLCDPALLGEWAHIPVVCIETPGLGDEARLYENILDKLGFPLPASYSTSAKLRAVVKLIKANRVGLIILDEFHNALPAHFKQLLRFNVTLKNLTNETGIPFLVAGTDIVDQVFHKDDQLHRRFSRATLERWPYDEDWRTLLRSFQMLIPLRKPSCLDDEGIARTLHEVSSGRIGDLSYVLHDAALLAVQSGEERITADLIRPL